MEFSSSVSAVLTRKQSPVWTISPLAMVFDAVALMAEKNIGALPVVENDMLIGIISERDYSRKVILKGRSSKETPVSEVMSAELITGSPADTIEACMKSMTANRVRHLPILDGDKLIGIISIGDLVKWIISAQSATIDQLEKYISGDYPG